MRRLGTFVIFIVLSLLHVAFFDFYLFGYGYLDPFLQVCPVVKCCGGCVLCTVLLFVGLLCRHIFLSSEGLCYFTKEAIIHSMSVLYDYTLMLFLLRESIKQRVHLFFSELCCACFYLSKFATR